MHRTRSACAYTDVALRGVDAPDIDVDELMSVWLRVRQGRCQCAKTCGLYEIRKSAATPSVDSGHLECNFCRGCGLITPKPACFWGLGGRVRICSSVSSCCTASGRRHPISSKGPDFSGPTECIS